MLHRVEKLFVDCEFIAVIEKRGRWYIGTGEEIPGVNTQGRTLVEVRRGLKEAIQLILESNRSHSGHQRRRHAFCVPVVSTGTRQKVAPLVRAG